MGKAASRKGGGVGAPARCKANGIAFSLALDEVPQATPAWIATGCKSTTICQNKDCPADEDRSTSIAENFAVCLLCFQSIAMTSKPCSYIHLLRLELPEKLVVVVKLRLGRSLKLLVPSRSSWRVDQDETVVQAPFVVWMMQLGRWFPHPLNSLFLQELEVKLYEALVSLYACIREMVLITKALEAHMETARAPLAWLALGPAASTIVKATNWFAVRFLQTASLR